MPSPEKCIFEQVIWTMFGIIVVTLTFDLKIQLVHLCPQQHLSCKFGELWQVVCKIMFTHLAYIHAAKTA